MRRPGHMRRDEAAADSTTTPHAVVSFFDRPVVISPSGLPSPAAPRARTHRTAAIRAAPHVAHAARCAWLAAHAPVSSAAAGVRPCMAGGGGQSRARTPMPKLLARSWWLQGRGGAGRPRPGTDRINQPPRGQPKPAGGSEEILSIACMQTCRVRHQRRRRPRELRNLVVRSVGA
ncbi:hypothetical protein BS78_07G204100 [Paspalum vaginatum]|nr:hypothetical protein BS78_07G204100 [Paspalum vaginatum]